MYCRRTLIDGAQLLRHATGTMIVRNNRDFNHGHNRSPSGQSRPNPPMATQAVRYPARQPPHQPNTPPDRYASPYVMAPSGTCPTIRPCSVIRNSAPEPSRSRLRNSHPLVEGQTRAAKRIVVHGTAMLVTPAQGLQLILIVKRRRSSIGVAPAGLSRTSASRIRAAVCRA